MTEHSYRRVLRDRRLAALLSGDAVAKTGDGASFVALPLLALHLHGRVDPAFAISLVTAAPYLLPIVLSLYFGLSRRRFNPRAVLLADSTLRSVLFVGLGVLAVTGTLRLWSLTAALFAGSLLRLLSGSARRLIATGMVAEDGRLAVNGVIGTSDSLALFVVGPALGGIIVALGDPGLALLVNGVGYVVLLIVAALAVPPRRARGAEPVAAISGWTVLRSRRVALRLLIVCFLFTLFYGPVEVALPLLVTQSLGAASRTLGILWTSFGLGALTGALLTNRLRRLPRHLLLVTIIGGWAASVGVLAVSPTVTVAAAALAAGGLIWGPFEAVAYTLLQDTVHADEAQPVLSLWAAGITVAAPLGLGIGGPLVAVAGSRGGLAVSAVTTLLLVPAAVRWLGPAAPQRSAAGPPRQESPVRPVG